MFPLLLKGYIVPGYQQNEILGAEIPCPLLFRENIVKLPSVTYWSIAYNAGANVYKIELDNV